MPAPGNKVRNGGSRWVSKPAGDKAAAAGRAGNGGAGLQTVFLDFETYYDDDYTLRKLSTSEYIRDSRFEAISVGIKIDMGQTEVYFGEDVAKALKRVDWSRTELVCHHTHFDGLILSHHFKIVPARYACTLSMGRALHPKSERNDLATVAQKYGAENKLEMPDFKGKHVEDLTEDEKDAIAAYNGRDVDSMQQVWTHMRPAIPEHEMELIHITVNMFANPVLGLDEKLAKSEHAREVKERQKAIQESNALAIAMAVGVDLPKAKNKATPVTNEQVLGSPKAFPALLIELGINPPKKISKYNGKLTYALSKADEEFTDLLAHPDDRVVALVRGRLAAKSTIGETRSARLLRSGSNGWKLPVYLNFCGAHTTRWSGGDKLNYQNFKKKGDLRKAILAPKGQRIVVIDSSTIEVRVLAWLANEEWLLEAFRKGLDPYIIFGSEIYGRQIDKKKDPLERFVAKSCVLGLGFQMGGPKLQVSILAGSMIQMGYPVRLDLNECYGLVNRYRAKNKKIAGLWETMNEEVLPELAKGRRGAAPKQLRDIIDYGREYIRLQGHLALHYPEAKCRVIKVGARKTGWGSVPARQRVEDGSYATPMGRSKLYGGLLTENVVQYLARQVVAEQMIEIAKRYRVAMMTHDEVAFLAPEKEADEALAWGLKIMQTSPIWAPDMPVNAEGGHDVCYSK